MSDTTAQIATYSFIDDCVSMLATGPLSPDSFRTFWSIERARRFLLLRSLHDLAFQHDELSGAVKEDVEQAWSQLVHLQTTYVEASDDVLLDPCVGRWLVQAVTQLRMGGEHPSVDLLFRHLGAIVAAIAQRSSQPFSVTVPSRDGYIALPTLGLVPSTSSPNAVISSIDDLVPERTLTGECDGMTVQIRLAERDPFRPSTSLHVAPLTDVEHERWQAVFQQAWELLVRDHMDYALEIKAGYRSITPLPYYELYRVRSTSSSDAFGGAEISYTDDPAQLAAALIHELRHSKLNALMHLRPLSTGPDPAVHRAPWRDDPRPLRGIIHGVYAFTGVSDFWRARCELGNATERRLAQFDYELWRRHVLDAIRTARDTGLLTESGAGLIDAIETRVSQWTAPIDSDIVASVDHLLIQEQAMWRAHHWRPDSTGDGHAVVANHDAYRLDANGVLERIRLAQPDWYGELMNDPARLLATVEGLTEVDVIARLRPDDARRLLLDRLDEELDPRAVVALAGVVDSPIRELLYERPDIVLGYRRANPSESAQDALQALLT
jgi:HEXXH motif-containing protein